MTKSVRFTKMHGAGNDYIYVDTLLYNVPAPEAAAKAWSSRHTGIGSDGLVLIGAPSDASKADYSMRIFNADGSEAMMCGNASRCIGKYLYEKGLCTKTEIRLETKSGVKTLVLHLDTHNGSSTVASVTVDMLEPQFDVPVQFTGVAPTLDIAGSGQALFVSMGNPHYVIFVDHIEGLDISAHGSRMTRHSPSAATSNLRRSSPTAPSVPVCGNEAAASPWPAAQEPAPQQWQPQSWG